MVGKGRQKIELKLIEKKAARLACFSKRRMGLFKKARELSVLCGATVAALAFSPAGKPMPFDVLALEALIDLKCAVSPEPLSLVEVDADAEASPSSGDWEPELLEAMDGKSSASPSGDWETEFREAMDGKSATFWWERADVQCMGLEELRRFEMSILGYKEKRMKGFDDLHEQRLRGERLLMDSTPCSVGSLSSADPILDDLMLGEEKRMKGFDDQEQRLRGERLLMDSTPCSVGSSSYADPILDDLMMGEDGWLMNTVEEFEEWLMNGSLEPADPCTTFFQQQQQPPSSALDAQILQLQQPAALEESSDDSAELLPTPTHLLPSFAADGYISIWDF